MGARLGMGTDLLHALYQHLDQDPALVRAGMSSHMRRMVKALHSDTHFFLKGQTDHCKTRLGTRPGDSWADIIFSFLWSRLLHEFESELAQLGILESIPNEQGLRNPNLPCTIETDILLIALGFLGQHGWMTVFSASRTPVLHILNRKQDNCAAYCFRNAVSLP